MGDEEKAAGDKNNKNVAVKTEKKMKKTEKRQKKESKS